MPRSVTLRSAFDTEVPPRLHQPNPGDTMNASMVAQRGNVIILGQNFSAVTLAGFFFAGGDGVCGMV